MKIYIAGPITSDPDYRHKFAVASKRLEHQGHTVLSGTILPSGLEYEEYMHVDMAMIAVSDRLYVLDGWPDSPGTVREIRFAKSLDKEVVYQS